VERSNFSAVDDFHRARRQAIFEELLARVSGRSVDLLSYEDVRRKLRATESARQKLEEIPLDAIVGSVGRYKDFTRTFLPRRDSDQQRWARVKAQVDDLTGVPPIEVYKIGQAYFVLDGNHRVSIARQQGASHIQAYVREVKTRVDLTPDTQPDDLIIKAEYADFLEHTQLDELRPGVDLSVTAPGQYRLLEEHIAVHRYFMGLEQQREIPYSEAVTHWYDTFYSPVVEMIQDQNVLESCSGRTETDLYLWLAEHRAELAERVGWEVSVEAAAADLADQCLPGPEGVVARVGEAILDTVVPAGLEAGPPPGQWRLGRVAGRQSDHLFKDILVAINGEEAGWNALEHALFAAQHEKASIYGLHIVSSEAERDGGRVQTLQAEFDSRCQAAGIAGTLVVEVGEVAPTIIDRARWTDLVVLSLSFPPAPRPIARLGSGLRTLIRRSPRPLLMVPRAWTEPRLTRVLLAYDGSPKAEEALFVATYISDQWNIPLVVMTVKEDSSSTSKILSRAQQYLNEKGVQPTTVEGQGPVAAEIMVTTEEQGCDLIIMGGYGFTPLLEVALGSVVDEVLRTSRRPMLICR
jgi:nucleotide-binding universal stress UspA family protein